jgi:hypothetical protein
VSRVVTIPRAKILRTCTPRASEYPLSSFASKYHHSMKGSSPRPWNASSRNVISSIEVVWSLRAIRVPPAGMVDKNVLKRTIERTVSSRLIGVIAAFTCSIYILSPIFIDDAGKKIVDDE